MIILDVNILVYAYNSSAPLHQRARAWWEELVQSGEQIGIVWPVFQAFIRLLSGRSVVAEPYPVEELFAICDEWWEYTNVILLSPSRETYRIFRELSQEHGLSGSATSDALIAAFALEHKAKLETNDTDFLRFVGLRTGNPFA